MITVEQAVKNLRVIQESYLWNTGADETFNVAIKCLLENREKIENKEEERKMWDEVINHLEATATELLDRENEKQSHAFAKGITFAVAMIKNHMKEVEE